MTPARYSNLVTPALQRAAGEGWVFLQTARIFQCPQGMLRARELGWKARTREEAKMPRCGSVCLDTGPSLGPLVFPWAF